MSEQKFLKSGYLIYLIPDIPKKSFSHPLILVLRDSLEQKLLALVHEFVRVDLIADRDKLFVNESKESGNCAISDIAHKRMLTK